MNDRKHLGANFAIMQSVCLFLFVSRTFSRPNCNCRRNRSSRRRVKVNKFANKLADIYLGGAELNQANRDK